jgi:hypothetical protein
MSYRFTPIEGYPNLFRDTRLGNVVNLDDFRTATWELDVSVAETQLTFNDKVIVQEAWCANVDDEDKRVLKLMVSKEERGFHPPFLESPLFALVKRTDGAVGSLEYRVARLEETLADMRRKETPTSRMLELIRPGECLALQIQGEGPVYTPKLRVFLDVLWKG